MQLRNPHREQTHARQALIKANPWVELAEWNRDLIVARQERDRVALEAEQDQAVQARRRPLNCEEPLSDWMHATLTDWANGGFGAIRADNDAATCQPQLRIGRGTLEAIRLASQLRSLRPVMSVDVVLVVLAILALFG